MRRVRVHDRCRPFFSPRFFSSCGFPLIHFTAYLIVECLMRFRTVQFKARSNFNDDPVVKKCINFVAMAEPVPIDRLNTKDSLENVPTIRRTFDIYRVEILK